MATSLDPDVTQLGFRHSARPAGFTGDSLDALEKLLRELNRNEASTDKLRRTLCAIRDAVEADLVYFYPGSSSQAQMIVGCAAISAGCCREFVRTTLGDVPPDQSQVVRRAVATSGSALELAAGQTAMIRLSKSRSIWILAVRLDPERPFTAGDMKLFRLMRQLLENQYAQDRFQKRLNDTLFDLIRSFATAIDAKDPYTCGHSERVARIAVRIGKQMKLNETALGDLHLAGLLHDIGKIGIDDAVLRKPGPLTPEEFELVKTHPVVGERIVREIKVLAHLAGVVRSHHERFDGGGYPDGMAGSQVPVLARVLAVSDSCDAMLSARPYRKPLDISRIESILSEEAGKQWDPAVVDAFWACRTEIYAIREKGLGESVAAAVQKTMQPSVDESATTFRSTEVVQVRRST